MRLVSHGGNTIGQDSDFIMVPERDFAVVTLSNSSPNGGQLNKQVGRWALETCLGVKDRDPEPVTLGPSELSVYTGGYETIAGWFEITAVDGHLMAVAKIKPEVLEALGEPPIPLGILPGPGDRYVVVR